ncbi:MAG TPA: WecB/TagA/CpsF family glycosyltransferase [Mycobacteriales bacterium]|nr:WecB/TagA/CpsF family glycosyltransferase [Mycobacteriales bacterium]
MTVFDVAPMRATVRATEVSAPRVTAPGSFECCGVRIDAVTLDEAVDRLFAYALAQRPATLHLCNAYTLSLAATDADYAATLNGGDLNLPDGEPVAFVGRRLGFSSLKQSTRGPDLMVETIRRGQKLGIRHYVYGSTQEVVDKLVAELAVIAPDALVVGAEAPPFRPLTGDEADELAARVRASEADIVWVGLGTPRQDLFVEQMRHRLGTTLVPIGAAFDFIAGTKPTAPEWLQHSGFEWAFRLLCEPRRLARRYFVGNARFVRNARRSRRLQAA